MLHLAIDVLSVDVLISQISPDLLTRSVSGRFLEVNWQIGLPVAIDQLVVHLQVQVDYTGGP